MTGNESIARVVELILQSKHAVVLTGAGISTPSGIPDFRGSESSLWSKVNPFAVASSQGFRLRPKAFYDWFHPLAKKMFEAEPNAAHKALAQLEQMGHVDTIITQNIDGLHQRAGSKHVLELHGDALLATCTKCHKVYRTDTFMRAYIENRSVPRCPSCRGIIKPNAVLIGEVLPIRTLLEAQKKASTCDLMLALGSSLNIVPAADLPMTAHESGASIVIINLQPTPFDSLAEVVIRADVAEILPQIVSLIRRQQSKNGNH